MLEVMMELKRPMRKSKKLAMICTRLTVQYGRLQVLGKAVRKLFSLMNIEKKKKLTLGLE